MVHAWGGVGFWPQNSQSWILSLEEGLRWEKGRAVTQKIRLNALKIPNLELKK